MIDNTNNLKGRILGTCMLQELIGRGGMSAVYLAQQQHLSRQVAVKILLPKVSTGSKLHQQFLLRFQHEADIIAKLDHINIIPIYEYAEQDGEAYLVMPYLTGGSLHNLLARYGSLSLQQTMNYIAQAASALDYAHLHGVIHRDLKPGNFLLHADGRLMLADFGIAHIVRDSSRTNYPTLTGPDLLLGTPDYMSPEMVRGERVDHRSDIYQLGIVLFQMLSGDIPFKDDNPYAVLLKRLQEPVPLLHPINSSIPLAVDEIIQKATAVNREDRFTSAGELARALQGAIAGPLPASKVTLLPSYAVPIEPSLPTYFSTIAAQVPARGNVNDVRYQAHNPALQKPVEVKRRGKYLGILLVTISAFLISGILIVYAQGQSSGITPPATPTLTTNQQQAQSLVQEYYTDWNKGEYRTAYNLLSTNYKDQYSYDSQLKYYEDTTYSSIKVNHVMNIANDRVQVEITDTATEKGRSKPQVYNGYYIVEKENGVWKLDPHFFGR
ncbi:MAG TPA: protein kinase [Ktedonobacteraceae bacterium]